MIFNIKLILSCIYFHFKKKINSYLINLLNFYKNINLKNFLIKKFLKKEIGYFKNEKFNDFVVKNSNFWKKQNTKIEGSENILVEAFVNHQGYVLSNCVIANYLKKIFKRKTIGLVKKSNHHGIKILESYNIDNIIKIEEPNIFERVKAAIISIKIIGKNRNIDQILKLKYKKTDAGLSAYDSFIRYTGVPNLKKINSELFYFFTESVIAYNKFDEIIKKNNIKFSVQAETAFLPCNSLFQICLSKKIKVFSRFGVDKIALRIYKNFNERYDYRDTISKKLFRYIYNKEKKKLINKYNLIQNKKIKNGSFGIDLRVISKKINKPVVTKKYINKLFEWDNKKIGVIFLHHLIDRNFHSGPRKYFNDNYSWASFILDQLKNTKDYNWIIKHHPTEHYYKSKSDLNQKISFLTNKYKHIKLFPNNISQISLLKITDLCVTSHGTATVEYIANGIPSLFIENSFYSHMNFAKRFRTTKKKITNFDILKKINIPNQNEIDEAKTFIYVKSEYLKSKSLLIPAHSIARDFDQDKFWKESINLLREYKFEKDELFKMISIQHKQNLSYTVNNNKFKIIGKLYNA